MSEEVSKVPKEHFTCKFFLEVFWVSFLLFPTSITALGICIINQFLIVFHNHLKNKAEERIWLFAQIKYWVWLNKDEPWQWSFLGNCHAGQIETVFRLRLLVSFELVLFLQGLPDYWFSQRVWLQSFWFQRQCRSCKRELGKGQAKTPWRSLVFEIPPFFMNKYSLDCCKPLFNFQSSKRVNFDNTCQSSFLYWRVGLEDSYLYSLNSSS